MRLAIATVTSLLVVGAVIGGAAAMPTSLPQQDGTVDLRSQANVRIDGASLYDYAGSSVAAAGDVNGDGIHDVVVAAPGATNNGRRSSGSVWVVFGRESRFSLWVDLASLGDYGFRIDGATAFDYAGSAVAGGGDVNGDGLSDLLVSAPGADTGSRTGSGSAYVVFGKSSTTNVDLGALGSGGFRIEGASPSYGYFVSAVANAGDVNGDGRSDVLVGEPNASNNARSTSGSVYVVFGRSGATNVDLAALGGAGFRIDGAAAYDYAGSSVAGVGDVNGDGRADVVLGAERASGNGRTGGAAYVVFGSASTATVDLAVLDQRGFRIDGAADWDYTGSSVAGAGDVNGDGRADVVVGAPGADDADRPGSGAAYVVFGRTSTAAVDLADLGSAGFTIAGANAYDIAGRSVSGGADVNGDGKTDVIVGAPGASNNSRIGSGSAYVVYGTTSNAKVDLATLAGAGFRIDGAQIYYQTGQSVAASSDVNGDARPDVIVGAPRSSYRDGAGAVYIVYGFGKPELAYDRIVGTVGRRIARQAPKVFRHTGYASFSIAPRLPKNLRLNEETGVITGKPTARQRRRTYTVTMVDLAGAATARLQITVNRRR